MSLTLAGLTASCYIVAYDLRLRLRSAVGITRNDPPNREINLTLHKQLYYMRQ